MSVATKQVTGYICAMVFACSFCLCSSSSAQVYWGLTNPFWVIKQHLCTYIYYLLSSKLNLNRDRKEFWFHIMYCFAGPSVIETHTSDDVYCKQPAKEGATLPQNLSFRQLVSWAITLAHSLQCRGFHNTPPVCSIDWMLKIFSKQCHTFQVYSTCQQVC